MAARRALRLAELQARSLRPLPRPPPRIGQWREAQGLSPSPSGPAPSGTSLIGALQTVAPPPPGGGSSGGAERAESWR
ncbi:large ribosomal subunit protein mL52 isoform X2 [Agelaius phoeniceus]|uniref:large ribosomal subunit protein mL52 isoform X2 n=1 Tax=Agelaius phoeniceus TaxID=39638 RepID=UPI004054F383